MNADPLKLIRFVCTAPLHISGRGDSVVTIHEGAWAFCRAGASADGHTWEATTGLPITAAIRFAQIQVGDPPTRAKAAAGPALARRSPSPR